MKAKHRYSIRVISQYCKSLKCNLSDISPQSTDRVIDEDDDNELFLRYG